MFGDGQNVTKRLVFHQINDSGMMAYSDYSTSAVVRVRASSPAWRYYYNVRLSSIDFRWVLYQILNNVILRVRTSSPRHDDIIIMSDYILLISDELYIKFWIMSFRGSGRAARSSDITRTAMTGRYHHDILYQDNIIWTCCKGPGELPGRTIL